MKYAARSHNDPKIELLGEDCHEIRSSPRMRLGSHISIWALGKLKRLMDNKLGI